MCVIVQQNRQELPTPPSYLLRNLVGGTVGQVSDREVRPMEMLHGLCRFEVWGRGNQCAVSIPPPLLFTGAGREEVGMASSN